MSESADDDYGVPIPGAILPQERWAKTAIKKLPPPGPLDWQAIFGRAAPLVLDLGCGNGRFTIASALARPEMDHLGIEILPVVIRYATRRANQRGLSNVRLAASGEGPRPRIGSSRAKNPDSCTVRPCALAAL
jgi:tRNA (guanine-N7-)-methyltransferase